MSQFNCTLNFPTQTIGTFSYYLENAIHESWFNHLRKLFVDPLTFGHFNGYVKARVWIRHLNSDYNSWPHKLVIQREIKESLFMALSMNDENWRLNRNKIKVKIESERIIDLDDYYEVKEGPIIYMKVETSSEKIKI